MEVGNVRRRERRDLEQAIRGVRTNGGDKPLVYPTEQGPITSYATPPLQLNASNFRGLYNRFVETVELLRQLSLQDPPINPFHMEGFCSFDVHDQSGTASYNFSPLLVERLPIESVGHNGVTARAMAPTVIDGYHRLFLAALLQHHFPDFKINVVGLPDPTVPFYSGPNLITEAGLATKMKAPKKVFLFDHPYDYYRRLDEFASNTPRLEAEPHEADELKSYEQLREDPWTLTLLYDAASSLARSGDEAIIDGLPAFRERLTNEFGIYVPELPDLSGTHRDGARSSLQRNSLDFARYPATPISRSGLSG